MDRKHFSSIAVSYSPDDGNGITDKKETVTLVEGPQVYQPDVGWSVFGSIFRSDRIVKWLLVSIAFVCALVVFYNWFVFQAISNVEHNGRMVAGSRITNNNLLRSNVELKFEASAEDGEMHKTTILSPNTVTSIQESVKMQISSTTVTAESTKTITPTLPTTTTLATTITTTQVPTTTYPAPAITITTTQVPSTTVAQVAKPTEGNLEIKVIRALLPKTDFWSDTDPFVKVTVATRNLGQTSMIRNNRYPYWNTYFTANAVKVGSWIKFEVYDADVTRNVLIGEKEILIIDIVTNDKLGKDIRLDVCNRYECQIIVQVKWMWL